MRDRTERPGQYALDLVADAAACAVLERAPVRIVSEESGVRGALDASITVVLDPVDGSTNCARGIAYWATSIAAVDGDDVVCALVANHATGIAHDGRPRRRRLPRRRAPARIDHDARRRLGDQRGRAAGARAAAGSSTAPSPAPRSSLCDVAAGGLDGHVDTGWSLYPWDYLGGYLACLEAGATVLEAHGEPLVTTDPTVRRRIVAAGTPEFAGILQRAVS